MELILIIVFASALLVYIFLKVIEPAYMLIYNRPVFVHFYVSPKKLDAELTAILESEFVFYGHLSAKRKQYFQHRVASFMEHYRFAGRDNFIITNEVKLRIAATYVMLTFGMRKYLYNVFKIIIVYPDVFPSCDNVLHKGEFNPAASAVVFSWKHFMEGLRYNNDNLNLGLHEFAHALHFQAMQKRNPEPSAIIYKDAFNEIVLYIDNPSNRRQLLDADYLRLYAFTNKYEFVAVILEHFFETPKIFKQKLPELYAIVKKMINFRE